MKCKYFLYQVHVSDRLIQLRINFILVIHFQITNLRKEVIFFTRVNCFSSIFMFVLYLNN